MYTFLIVIPLRPYTRYYTRYEYFPSIFSLFFLLECSLYFSWVHPHMLYIVVKFQHPSYNTLQDMNFFLVNFCQVTDRQNTMHKSQPCIRTGGLKNVGSVGRNKSKTDLTKSINFYYVPYTHLVRINVLHSLFLIYSWISIWSDLFESSLVGFLLKTANFDRWTIFVGQAVSEIDPESGVGKQ